MGRAAAVAGGFLGQTRLDAQGRQHPEGHLAGPAVTRRLVAEFAAGPVGEGLSDAGVAERLDMAEATVKTHVSRLLGRLELRSRVQAAVLAQELGV